MKKRIIIIIVAIIIIAGVLGAFYYSIHSNNANVENSTEVTELEDLLTEDLEDNYPASPRAVVNEYSRYLVALYNEDYTDDQFNTLTEKMRILLDDDLLEENPIEYFRSNLKSEADSYKSDEWQVTDFVIPSSDEVTYDTVKGNDCALVTVSYYIKQKTTYSKTVQDYVFRQDNEGRWKILGYSLHSGSEDDDSEDAE